MVYVVAFPFVGGISEFIGSGIDLVSDKVYDFSITINPETKTWDVTVTDGETTFTATDLGWRTSLNAVGGVLNFGAQTATIGDVRTMSIDNVRISQVPEPSVMALLFGCLLNVLFWRKRRA